ncbi:MAG: hypothetical protein ABWX67_09585 [Allosphingosinicella sp.]
MATMAEQDGDRTMSVGRVFSRAFSTIGSNPLATFGVAFLFGTLPSLAINFALRGQLLTAETITLLGTAGTIAVGLFWVVISVLLAMITQGALVRATVAHSEGRKASFGESAMAGLSVALPLFLVGLLGALGIMLGLVFLLVPGIILYVMWSVAAPALVEERLGPVEALGRSRYLTKGARWRIFGLNLVILVLYWMFSIGVVALFGDLNGSSDFQNMSVALILGSALVQTITSVVWGVIQSSLYVDLRDWKDGPRTEKLADIFA